MMRAATMRLRENGLAGFGRSPTIPLIVGVILLAMGEVVLLSRGGRIGFAVLGATAVVAGALLFADHVFEVFVGWIVLEGIAFPFIRFPYHAAPFFTFD